jgi:hypothetical protein
MKRDANAGLMVPSNVAAKRLAVMSESDPSALATRRNIDDAVSSAEAYSLGQKNRPSHSANLGTVTP